MQRKAPLIQLISESKDENFIKEIEFWMQFSLVRAEMETTSQTSDKNPKNQAENQSKNPPEPPFSDSVMNLFVDFYDQLDDLLVRYKNTIRDLTRQETTTPAKLSLELEIQIKGIQYVCQQFLDNLKPHIN